jgi:hypothetical protein
METSYWELLPADFNQSSRVWIYQSNRAFSQSEIDQVELILNSFLTSWNSHGTPVKGFAKLFYNWFIILMADEKATQVSGCSTDSSVHLIREIEKTFMVRMFDRQSLAFLIDDRLQLVPLSQLSSAFAKGEIHPETLYFNNTILTKNELENNWIIPVSKSWLASRMHFPGKVES